MVRGIEAFISRERRKVKGEVGEVPEYTESVWMKRLLELKRDHENAVFFRRMLEKGLA